MSLSRTALRLATVEALRPHASIAGNGPWPTIAGKRVFDTALDAFDILNPSNRAPVVVVYTDHDNGDPGQKAGGPPFKRIVDLLIEIAVYVKAKDDDGTYAVGLPQSDAELEASLDLLDAQVRFALMYAPSGLIWRNLTGSRVGDIRSLPLRSGQEATRLAMRTITMQVQVPDDCYDAAPADVLTGNAALPQPLRGVIAALNAAGYGAKIGAGLAEEAPQMPVATPLEKIVMDVTAIDPPGVPAPEPASDLEVTATVSAPN